MRVMSLSKKALPCVKLWMLLNGTIVEKQRDIETSESKFIVRDCNPLQSGLEVVVKFGVTGRLYIITGYSI